MQQWNALWRVVRRTRNFDHAKFRSIKFLVRCLEILTPSLTTSPQHIPEVVKNFFRNINKISDEKGTAPILSEYSDSKMGAVPFFFNVDKISQLC